METTRSKFLSVKTFDIVKGFIVAFLTASLTGLLSILDTGLLPNIEEGKQLVALGLMAGIGYVFKNVLTNSNGEILKREKKIK